jgi:acetyl esterase/lipase
VFSGWVRAGRVVLEAVLGAASLLALFRVPARVLWRPAVVVTEWGHLLAGAGFALALRERGWWRAIGLAAGVLYLTPLLRALVLARGLPDRMSAAFGVGLSEQGSLELRALFFRRRAGVRREEVVYREVEGYGGLRLDLYRPRRAFGEAAPVVVVVHGGSWRHGSSRDFAALNRRLAERGYFVAAPEYRFAPRWPFPAARDDVRAAVGYLKANAERLGLDPERVVLLGRSAGGQLALLAGYGGDPAVRGVICFYAPTDLGFGYRNPGNPRVIRSREVLGSYMGGGLEELPEAYAEASPINHVGPRTPPTLMVYGGRDELVHPIHGERLALRLERARRPHLLLRLPWATHGFDFNPDGPGGQVSAYAVERFLGAVTRWGAGAGSP